MIRNDARDCPLTTASVEALAEFEKAQRLFSLYAGDPLAALQAAVDIDPGFALAHVMRAHLLIAGAEMTARDDADAALKAADRYAAGLTARERGHLAAARAWLNGDLTAASRIFDAVLADHPRDLLALQMGHTVDFYLGDSISLRDRVARVLPHWDAGVPGFGHVQGMHAFGRAELGDYAAAERSGRAAVKLSGYQKFSTEPPPYQDALPYVRALIDAFTSQAAGRPHFWATPEFWFFNLGLVCWLIIYFGLPKWLTVYVFGHELTHALMVKIMGGRVSDFSVGSDGGYIVSSKINTWIALAPYFVPIYSVFVILLYGIVSFFVDLQPHAELATGCGSG